MYFTASNNLPRYSNRLHTCNYLYFILAVSCKIQKILIHVGKGKILATERLMLIMVMKLLFEE